MSPDDLLFAPIGPTRSPAELEFLNLMARIRADISRMFPQVNNAQSREHTRQVIINQFLFGNSLLAGYILVCGDTNNPQPVVDVGVMVFDFSLTFKLDPSHEFHKRMQFG
jgi:hypothetical protein